VFFVWGSPTFVVCALIGWWVVNALISHYDRPQPPGPPAAGPPTTCAQCGRQITPGFACAKCEGGL
jgi:hypothetical protein